MPEVGHGGILERHAVDLELFAGEAADLRGTQLRKI
jgi:hypothetical protein